MCGGTLEINNNESVAVCEYCGTKQTLPKLDDDKRANLYDRANHFRRNNDFDKAMGIYEKILNEDGTDAEAYWSLVLCRYGIEYVEDPATHKRVPTVNRAQFTSIFDDDNYKSALQYADGGQRRIYEEEAQAINEIQKGILAISQKEEPFDVFICYKETDNNGRRTQDSVLANDLYYQLKQEGFKVFFSRITLEDKLGTAFEPYIFAALNSAKVMVVLGTKPEYFNAVWVKNEWSRYLSIVKASKGKKILIPAYRDMDPYDLPEEFSHLQAQDMSKLGFMQDLIRGIKKIVRVGESKAAVVQQTVISGSAEIAPLLKRAFMFLEDGDWDRADDFCEQVLNINPECAEAYLGKLMAELRVHKREDLKNQPEPFENRNNYEKTIRFADEKLKTELTDCIQYIYDRNEHTRLDDIYHQALNEMEHSTTESAFKHAAELFQSIAEYENAIVQAEKCRELAETARKDAAYDSAKAKMTGEQISSYENAIQILETISGWKDADQQIIICQNKIEEIKAKEEAFHLERKRLLEIGRMKAEKRKKKIKKIAMIVMLIVCICAAVLIALQTVIIPSQKLKKANALIDSGDYISAYKLLDGLNYQDSEDKLQEIKPEYQKARLENSQVGDVITFGAYEQDDDSSNGKEDIEWQVLDKKDGKLLVISKYALDCKPYNTENEDITWENCTLRKWLNNDFINAAFTAGEQNMIPTVTVSADENPEYNTDPGNATQDKIFLLSIPEVNRYFSSDDAMICKPTPYAAANNAYESDSGNCWWWLRSPGFFEDYAAFVYHYGGVNASGNFGNFGDNAVRPVLWIDLES